MPRDLIKIVIVLIVVDSTWQNVDDVILKRVRFHFLKNLKKFTFDILNFR